MTEPTEIVTLHPFNPNTFPGTGDEWIILREDPTLSSLTRLNLSRVKVLALLEEGDGFVTAEQPLKLLKAVSQDTNQIPLGAAAFMFFWENKDKIPEEWKEEVGGEIQNVFFTGTILKDPDSGEGCIVYLSWKAGQWSWDRSSLREDFFHNDRFAVLAT